jgi:3-oxoacyl-(acyl-carrier-protein) synthase
MPSSLVALHLAVQSIRNGEIECAIVGGSNATLSLEMPVLFSQMCIAKKKKKRMGFDFAELCCLLMEDAKHLMQVEMGIQVI